MADLNARIIAKASATAGEIPVGSDLDVAELAVNTADGKLYTKHSDGSVIDLSSGIGSTGVASVNGQAGAVTLGITDLSNVEQTIAEERSSGATTAGSTAWLRLLVSGFEARTTPSWRGSTSATTTATPTSRSLMA